MTTLLPFPRLRHSVSASAEPVERDQMVLADAFGRVATDLRISLTDRCNLRCTYCMPVEGLDWLPRADVLTDEEILRLVTIGVARLGITTVRLTGGEPLLRKNLELLVADIAALSPTPEIALTTNGIGLAARAEKLAAAGLKRINVSLDTLDPDTFAKISRRRRLADVLAGVAAAREAGLQPVKINTVLLRGINDHEAFDLLQWAMAEESEHARTRGSAPAELFRVAGTDYSVGIIASVTQPFCGACDRVRLTADGQIRNCLFARTESDLRTPLRSGASDAELAARWVAAVAGKKPGHGINDPSFLQPDRPMSAIGG